MCKARTHAHTHTHRERERERETEWLRTTNPFNVKRAAECVRTHLPQIALARVFLHDEYAKLRLHLVAYFLRKSEENKHTHTHTKFVVPRGKRERFRSDGSILLMRRCKVETS